MPCRTVRRPSRAGRRRPARRGSRYADAPACTGSARRAAARSTVTTAQSPGVPVGPCGCVHVEAGEDGAERIRPGTVAQRQRQTGTRLAGRAPAHGIHDDQHGARRLGHERVHRFRRAQLADAEVDQFLAHRRHKIFGIRHTALYATGQAGPTAHSRAVSTPTRVAEPAAAPGRPRQRFDNTPGDPRNGRDDELGDPVATLDDERSLPWLTSSTQTSPR